MAGMAAWQGESATSDYKIVKKGQASSSSELKHRFQSLSTKKTGKGKNGGGGGGGGGGGLMER